MAPPPAAANGKSVILARPHSFVVAQMRSFLMKLGYNVIRATRFEDISGSSSQASVVAAVISTAVTAEVARPFADVFFEVRRCYPTIPLAVSTLVGFDHCHESLKLAIPKELKQMRLVAAREGAASPGLGDRTSLLVLTKEDVTKPELYDAASQAVRKHFHG